MDYAITSNNTLLTIKQHRNSIHVNISWPPFTPPLLLLYNLVQLMLFAVAIAGLHLFIFMWMYKMYTLCTTTGPICPALLGQNLPDVSGQTISMIRLSFVWVNMWTNSVFGYAWGKQGD